MTRVLIIDDDESMCYALSRTVKRLGFEAFTAGTLADGLKMARNRELDAVFLDVRLPDGNGLTIITDLIETASRPEVIIITGEGDPDGAELAISNGAWDYIEKADSIQKISLTLKRAVDFHRERGSAQERCPVRSLRRDRIVGDSHVLTRALDLVAQSAASDATVLITGETGTGKELFAKAIHENSLRAGNPFVTVDCAALPENLVESILFGHRRGAFTGADKDHEGLVLQADGGTLFLDEVGEMPLSLQKAFLRVLQERTVRPLGSKEEKKSNFRLVAATNRNLEDMIETGAFRSDLYFRIRSVGISLPPLRDHKSDIRALANHYIDAICARMGIERKGCYADFFDILEAYDWPGNIRELVHTLEHALAASTYEPYLFGKHLPAQLRAKVARSRMEPAPAAFPTGTPGVPTGTPLGVPQGEDAQAPAAGTGYDPEALPLMQDYRDAVLAQAERRYLRDLMAATSYNVKEAIRVSGLSQSRLYALLKKYGIATR
ncbi:MAG: sigma-54-dependent transcriptional regulator [Desulfovibrionaceae bacterium]